MKRIVISLVLVFIILTVVFSFTACEADTSPDYTIEIIGIEPNPIIVTKAQIMEIAKTNNVIYTKDNPCYASDKTDENQNPIPHTLKGVYLDNILEVYADGAVSGSYSAMRLKDVTGHYENVITSYVYNEEHGGSKMIIAYEYDGHILNEDEPSGALRVVFPDQPQNTWVKMIKQIEFTDAKLTPPAPKSIAFMEILDNEYYSSFQKQVATENDVFDNTYYGISLNKLYEEGILNADEEDKMYIIAWDFISDGTDSFYREYTNWKSYDYYINAFLTYSYNEDSSDTIDLDFAPVFDGENISKGMKVKNTLVLSVKDTALMSLDIAFERFDSENSSKIEVNDILSLVNIDEEEGFKVWGDNDNYIELTKSQAQSAYIEKIEGEYVLTSQEGSILINKITVS